MELFKIFILALLGVFSVATGSKLGPVSTEVENEDFYAVYEKELAVLESLNLTLEELIKSEGYTVEDHTVTTTDGYVLKMQRIPKGKNGESNGKVAFLMHGILCSAADFVVAGPGKGLGYILADEGYDVWMGNARGNTQSRKHISLDPDKDSDFWQFSWHEIGTIDLPTMIDYVLKKTGQSSLYHAGHSQGTTTFYVMTSKLPEYNNKIKVHVSLAPIGYMSHMTSPILKALAQWDAPLSLLASLIGLNEFLPKTELIDLLADTICSNSSVTEVLCSNVLFAIFGFSPNQMNGTLLPMLMHYTPAGSSTKQIWHYAQEINSGRFCEYDFALIENWFKYGNGTPPDYDLSKITTPIHLIYSHNDWLSAEVDVDRLGLELPNVEAMYLVKDEEFNHLDYLFGIDAKELVYDTVVDIFNSH